MRGRDHESIAADDYCVVAPPTPYDPASGLSLAAPRALPADARCPVCGMYPARSRDWAAQLIFSNGDAQFFDSPLSLFIYLGRVEHYALGRKREDVVAIYVTDAVSRDWVDARQAFYVQGSSAFGPMRAGNFPAFAQLAEARSFSEKRGGQVVTLEGVDAVLVQRLAGNRRHSHDE
ncbi:MAG: nitrous oxide reductase accessory protein NosL [Burkholderiales bacterium]|nr:nitrous oxide reductase accessory protein NosL [Burkholderiales bacterium]